MKYLLSVPPSLARYDAADRLLAEAAGPSPGGHHDAGDFFCCSDPVGQRLGSGSGTIHLLEQCFLKERHHHHRPTETFADWLGKERRLLIHAGGQNRRLPSYGPGAGKVLTPIPPFAGVTGQRIDQTLLSLQLPLLRAVALASPPGLNTLVACGDVYLYGSASGLATVTAALAMTEETSVESEVGHAGSSHPTANASMSGKGTNRATAAAADGTTARTEAPVDIVCFGVPSKVEALRNHGVFFTHRDQPDTLDFMLQKPPPSLVHAHLAGGEHTCWMDVGLWLLSDKAVHLLRARSQANPSSQPTRAPSSLKAYELYSDFGYGLGRHAQILDAELNSLRARVVPLPGFSFYHFGTTRELISSTVRLNERTLRSQEGFHGYGCGGVGVGRHGCSGGAVGSGAWALTNALSAPPPMPMPPTPLPSLPSPFAAPANGSPSGGQAPVERVVAPEWISRAHPTVVIQNAILKCSLHDDNTDIWMENAYVGSRWTLRHHHVITGVPDNDWALTLPSHVCVDVVPLRASEVEVTVDTKKGTWRAADTVYAARPYGFMDSFQGSICVGDGHHDEGPTTFLGGPLAAWLRARNLTWQHLLEPSTSTESEAAQARMHDLQYARLFPCVDNIHDLGDLLQWMVSEDFPMAHEEGARLRAMWLSAPRLSASALNDLADVAAQVRQREGFQRRLYASLAEPSPLPLRPGCGGDGVPVYTAAQHCFYHNVDLAAAAERFAALGVMLPLSTLTTKEGDDSATSRDSSDSSTAIHSTRTPSMDGSFTGAMTKIHHCMLYARYLRCCAGRQSLHPLNEFKLPPQQGEETGESKDGNQSAVDALSTAPRREEEEEREALDRLSALYESAAFNTLRSAMTQAVVNMDGRHSPRLSVFEDQIVWGRSPARVDLSGGWTDTPPYSVMRGGAVINVAVELNGQPPIQVYIKLHEAAPVIVLRSIDLGCEVTLRTYEDIAAFTDVGSPFAIPKAALALAGFLPEFCSECFGSLAEQLHARFGGRGLEVTLLVAIPAGSGLGTSSLVAGTLLQSLAACCGLPWDVSAVCRRVLVLEQLLTTGGGWQDQYGGLYAGVKLIQSTRGFRQDPSVRWLPDHLFTDPTFRACHLLYYTGITRTAKNILVEIVRGMFLNERRRLEVLQDMHGQTQQLYDAITRADFQTYGALIAHAWEQNKRLDAGTCTDAVRAIFDRIDRYILGAKLTGAGGGGYMLIVARDAACAAKIREELTRNPPNARARFVDMSLSTTGVQVSKS